MSVVFHKMHGCGNDFVFIDNRSMRLGREFMPVWARTFCDRKTGVGADGILFIGDVPKDSGCDYRWDFYNSDGSRGEMCGNASRCSCLLAAMLGIAGNEQAFLTDAGPVTARIRHRTEGTATVTSRLTRPFGFRSTVLAVGGRERTVYSLTEGVPHAVLFSEDLEAEDVDGIGRFLRQHAYFAPDGTNVNFVRVDGPDNIAVRTYERGVEAETLACGTGSSASVWICARLGMTGNSVSVATRGGETLGVSLEGDDVFLTGAAAHVFTGETDPCFVLPGLPQKTPPRLFCDMA